MAEAVAVRSPEHELKILKLALSFLRRISVRGASGHGVPLAVSGRVG